MFSINTIVLGGYLCAAPELRQTANGTAAASFRLAVNQQPYKGQERESDFFDVVVFGGIANFVASLPKGTRLTVKGEMHSRRWQDKDGNNRLNWEVRADNVQTIDPRPQNQQAPVQGQYQQNAPANQYAAQAGGYPQQGNQPQYQQPPVNPQAYAPTQQPQQYPQGAPANQNGWAAPPAPVNAPGYGEYSAFPTGGAENYPSAPATYPGEGDFTPLPPDNDLPF